MDKSHKLNRFVIGFTQITLSFNIHSRPGQKKKARKFRPQLKIYRTKSAVNFVVIMVG